MSLMVNQFHQRRIHPQKFALWTSFASIFMMFIALTSAYIVKQAAGNWLEFPLPTVFIFSTVSIVLSSLALHWSWSSFKQAKKSQYKLGLMLAIGLGLGFVVLQYLGWTTLFSYGVDLKGNVSGSFFYLITGLHALHVLGGITALLITALNSFMLDFKPTKDRIHRYELVLHYWHFVDVLWIFLLVFIIVVK